MNILVTGAKGFIGKNLIAQLNNIIEGKANVEELNLNIKVNSFDLDSPIIELEKFCKNADFVFHLAGVNRPLETDEYMKGNFGFTSTLLDALKKNKNNCPVMLASSIQAELDNPYGKSKKAGEDLLFRYGEETGAPVLVYRFPNVFGKWCRPNYNSAIATFCYNISRGLPVSISDSAHQLNLVYIDDVIDELIRALIGKETRNKMFCEVPITYSYSLGEIVNLIESFKASRNNLSVPNMGDEFSKKLYSTYLSYLPENNFNYSLKMNNDNRGSFTEIIKTIDRGQVSVNISKPKVVKGNHWHHSKNEKFVVVHGTGVIRFRKIDSSEIKEYFVSGNKIEVVDVPVGYTHNIENLGDTDMITIMWANELFDPDKPDTYFLEV